MAENAELTAEGGELNVQAINEEPGTEENAGEQAAVCLQSYAPTTRVAGT